MTFEQWWEKNKSLYILAGVSESAAKSIWIEAVFSVEKEKYLEKLLI